MAENPPVYPYPIYNYRVTIEEQTIGFSDISGLTVVHQPVVYKHGLSHLIGHQIIPGIRDPINITMKRGITNDPKFSVYLNEWFYGVYDDVFFIDRKRDLYIMLCDANGNAIIRWTAESVLPVRLEAPTFNANENSFAVESMEVMAHNLRVDFTP
jgi:phage tail-like protein